MEKPFEGNEWDALGKNIQNMVDNAVHSQDFRRLSEEVGRAVNQAMKDGSEALRKAGFTRPITASSRVQRVTVETTKKTDLSQYYRTPSFYRLKNFLKIFWGGFLSFSMITGFLSCLALLLFDFAPPYIIAALVMLGFSTGSVLLLKSGVSGLGRMRRFQTYRRTLADKTYCEVLRLAKAVGKRPAFVVKDLNRLLRDGVFPEGHLDDEDRNFILTHETYQLYLESKSRPPITEAPAPNPEAQPVSQVKEVLDRGNRYLAQIRHCNDLIPGEEISLRISRVELLVQRIFLRAEAHPEIIPDLKRLMDYYLPMTVKLLTAYAEMDAQPIQGENIRSAKKEIEATLDTLETAFEKLLDSVFQDTALDISTDISVLNSILAQEGLTRDEFHQ